MAAVFPAILLRHFRYARQFANQRHHRRIPAVHQPQTRRAAQQRIHRAVIADDAFVQHNRAPADVCHFAEQVRREQNGAVLPRAADDLAHLRHLQRVKSAAGFIEDEQRRLPKKRLRDAQALPIPLRQSPGQPMRICLQPRQFNHAGDFRRLCTCFQPAQTAAVAQILRHRHVGIQRRLLRQIPRVAAGFQRLGQHVIAADGDVTARLAQISRDGVHQCRFARAIAPKQRNDFALLRGECDAFQDLPCPVAPGHAAHVKRRFHGLCPPCCGGTAAA